MPAWVTITTSDLNDYLVAAQASALRTAALAAGQTDPFGRVMPDIIQRIRLKIQSCPGNQVSATANTIPPELKWAACYLIIEALQARMPTLKLTEEQRTQVERAVSQLDRIADCKDTVTIPDDPLGTPTTQLGGNVEIVKKTDRRATRDSMAGL